MGEKLRFKTYNEFNLNLTICKNKNKKKTKLNLFNFISYNLNPIVVLFYFLKFFLWDYSCLLKYKKTKLNIKLVQIRPATLKSVLRSQCQRQKR